MTREEVTKACMEGICESDFLLLEAATGFGKSKLSIDMVNYLAATKFQGKKVSMLLLVAKRVHKQTWLDEIDKWGGLDVDTLTMECYESLKKHQNESFDIIVMDEVHHIGSNARLESLHTIHYGNIIGLSATVSKKLKSCLLYDYHAKIITCDVVEAIKSEVLPEPRIVLLPLVLDNAKAIEAIEVNSKAKGPIHRGPYNKLWTYKKMKVHAVISCTQMQKVHYYNSQIDYEKKRYMLTRQEFLKNKWLFDCGERIKYLANLKNNIVLDIIHRLKNERTITFCKTIEQAEFLGKYCIHSKNKESDKIYEDFNNKKIHHITSVNILNENANLVDCKYAIFANYSSSEICSMQRLGRALRHKSPVIIMPFYKDTREEEIIKNMLKDFSQEYIHTLHTMSELNAFIQRI